MVCDLRRALCALVLAGLAGCAAPAEVHHVYTTEIVYRDAKPQNRAKGFGPAQGAPAAGGGGEGMQNPATADLDMDGNAITGGGNATFAGVTSATVSAQIGYRTSASGTSLDDTACRSHVYYNTGATALVPFTLTSASTQGQRVSFVVTDADGIQVSVSGGATIRTPAGVTATNGYLHSTRIGSTLTLLLVSEGDGWVAEEITGTWRVDSTSSAGYAYTPLPATATTPTGTWTSNVTYTGFKRQIGRRIYEEVMVSCSGAPTSAALAITPQHTVDESKLIQINSTGTLYGQVESRLGFFDDHSPATLYTSMRAIYSVANNNVDVYTAGFSGAFASVTQSAPITWAANDSLTVYFEYEAE